MKIAASVELGPGIKLAAAQANSALVECKRKNASAGETLAVSVDFRV